LTEKIYSEEEQVLKDFLLDIDCLDQLSEWTKKFNLFDILKITRTELRHSNILSWLINPNENHGLNDNIIKGFVQYVITSFSNNEDVFEVLLMDYHSFIVQREWKNIDLLAISFEEKFLLCIENKIFSEEHNNQLIKYRETLEEIYPDYRKMFVFLSPDGSEASDSKNWCSMSYQDVVDIIEKSTGKVNLLPEVEMLINNYVEAIRMDIVGDEKLAQICRQIYTKHQKALDLIFENKPDKASDVAEIFKKWALEKTEKGEIEVVLDKCNKTFTRFKTKEMSEVLPDAEYAGSGWNTKNYYFFEIYNKGGNEFFIQLSLSSKNIPDNLKDICEKINEFYPSKIQKENWQWRTPFSTTKSKIDDEISEDKIYDLLNKKLEAVKVFEKELKVSIE